MKKYLEYISDNPRRYWFKRKIVGWGWTPATWEGYLVLFIFSALIAYNAITIRNTIVSESEFLFIFLPRVGALTILLIAICWRTGESPKWQWGYPVENE